MGCHSPGVKGLKLYQQYTHVSVLSKEVQHSQANLDSYVHEDFTNNINTVKVDQVKP